MLAESSIHLTGILLLGPYLTEENHRECVREHSLQVVPAHDRVRLALLSRRYRGRERRACILARQTANAVFR
jgi:hypothetical protein